MLIPIADNLIPRGCTCKTSFPIPYRAEDILALFITYQQNKITKVEKELSECTFEDGKVSVNLSQEQTLSFEVLVPIRVQIRVRLKDGTATKSTIMETYTDEVLKGGVI